MKSVLALASIILVSSATNAAPLDPKRFELTPACKASVEQKVLEQETEWLKTNGQKIAGTLEAKIGMNFWPTKAQPANVNVSVTDSVDGRYVVYRTQMLPEEAKSCAIHPLRSTKGACRYSNSNESGDLETIPGMKVTDLNRTITHKNATETESQQIRFMLANDDLKEAIEGTDDGEVYKLSISTPDGTVLDYFKYYGGGNPVGMMFLKDTLEVKGDNSDDSICLGY